MSDLTNPLLGPIERLKTLLASAESFQAFVDVTTGTTEEKATAAAARIYCPAIHADDVSDARPFALIFAGPDWESQVVSSTGWQDGGNLGLLLEKEVPESMQACTTAKFAEAEYWFFRLVGNLITELKTLLRQPGQLCGSEISFLEGPPVRTDPSELKNKGDNYQVLLEIKWGGRS